MTAQFKQIMCSFPESAQANLWLKLLKFFKFAPAALIESCSSKFVDLLVRNFKCHPSYKLALRTVVNLNPDVMLPPLLEIVVQVFNNSEILNVTPQEYAIYLSPAGQLYDKSIISSKDSDVFANAKNMKRESKIYSFKEQQEEILLRKELEEKKRKEGKLIEPELTPKQKELVKIQMEKESAIREKLQKAAASLDCAVKIVESVAKGAPLALALQLPTLIPPLVRGLSSPLSAPNLAVLYITLNETAFISVSSGSPTVVQRVSHTSLRLLNPKCELNSAWENQDINTSMRKAITDVDQLGKKLTAPALTYLLPMIEVASLGVSSTDPLIPICIRILSTQAKLRKSDGHLHDPGLLPRCQLITLLINIIGMTGGRVQQQAVSCLQDLAMASNGIGEAAVATHSEIGRLLFALQDSSPQVRDAAQRALFALLPVLPKNGASPDMEFQIVKRLWVAKFDVVTENQEIANKMWDQGKFDANVAGLCEGLLEDLTHPIVDIQQAAAHGLASLLPQTEKCSVPTILQLLLEIYAEKNNMIPAKVDSLGRIVEKPIDTWEPRSGVALALSQLAPLLSPPQVTHLAKFYVDKGLGDRNDVVRNNMLAAALAAVDQHGKETVSQLLPIFEPVLDKGPDCSSYDAVRQSVVILMGSLARHLDKDDPKVKPIVTKLIDALSTPSQQVQEAVASCLPALVPSIREEAPALVQQLLDQLLSSESYGQRKGAAYGLAGIVKGMGILVLKQLDIMTTLTEAIQDKKNYRHREGALFAFEMLCSVLGRLFEPYIVHVLPHLLLCFGDGNQYVRDATDDCAKVVMSKLSAHGVKLVLPSLLAALEKDSWRTKTGSVELLGAMAYCAPKQLSSCLPSIVPKLIEVLSDSHVKVQNAGTEALKQIGSVIRNPEIQGCPPAQLYPGFHDE
ncbi:translational activator [Nesidiocoris tenuis]|uniref:Translational activator n=1 Tax=Nesidiocoris tenuis TaxID=355587 RepID=A0ABN7B369_9HEMI|nr:translational activator [Nesidiocoris tenuis]